MTFLNKTRARMFGYNPICKIYHPEVSLFGEVIYEEQTDYIHQVCEVCGEVDENCDSTNEISNGNYLIEYPKRSMQFWCPLCFIWNHNRKTVNRVLGSDPKLPHHDEKAADEYGLIEEEE